MRIHAFRRHAGYAAVKLLHDFLRKLFGIACYDLEFISGLKALQDRVAYFTRDEERNEREQHGIDDRSKVISPIDEDRNKNDDRIERGREHAHAEIAEFFVDNGGKNARTARSAALFEHDGKRDSEENTARHGAE